MIYQKFIFEDYRFDEESHLLELKYSLDDQHHFIETYRFDFDFVDYDKELLDRAISNLFLIAGVSYFKIYPFAEIVIKKGLVDEQTSQFLSKTYKKGLGEFFYVNSIDPSTVNIQFPITCSFIPSIENTVVGNTKLIGIGGGKDSLVTTELLRQSEYSLAVFSVNHKPKLQPLIDRIGLPFFYVERNWDKQLIEINQNGGLNGHIPISAILAATGSLIAVLSGNSDVLVSNENSANEPTLNYKGVDINHQYSKSLEFEIDWQNQLRITLGNNVNYYSALRPFSEIAIAEIFSKIGYEKYKDVFSSCNHAFTHYSDKLFWDGKCSKCAFVFLALTPFIEQSKLENLFEGKNLLLDKSLNDTYRQLLGIEGYKPLECVGEIKESRTAMKMSSNIYPLLSELYDFELPQNYNYKLLHNHSMPQNIHETILKQSNKYLF